MNRAIGNFEKKDWSVNHGLTCSEPSKTIQSQAEEADINTIVRNFGITGKLPQTIRTPTWDDYTNVSDYQTALNAIIEAQKSFEQLPSNVRDRFGHDPGRFVDFCSNPANLEEMRALGLAPTPAVVAASV